MMIGLDQYIGTKESFVGVDFLNLASGAFKTAAGAIAPGPNATPDAQALDKARQIEAQKKAEASASTWRKVGIGALIVAAIGGVYWYRHRS